MRSLSIVFGAAAFASGCAYQPGSLLRPRSDRTMQARQLGCLDVAISIGADPVVPARDPVLQIDFGNRCDRSVDVDLRALHVSAQYADGIPIALAVFDPRGEIERLPLDARWRGAESLEYVGPDAQATPPARVCVAIDAIAPSEHVAPPPPLCFAREGERFAPVHGGAS